MKHAEIDRREASAFEQCDRVFQRAMRVHALTAGGRQRFALGAAAIDFLIGRGAFETHGAGSHHRRIDRRGFIGKRGRAGVEQAGIEMLGHGFLGVIF